MNRLPLASALALAVLHAPATAQAPIPETREQHDARMAWWREARFGMFIHWGLYAIPAGVWKGQPVGGAGEWIMNSAKIPVSDYEPLVREFNPVRFDADIWVRTAAGAGMKYIVITSKHHDGFCLFDSALTDYDIASTPFKRDVLKELAAACAKSGIRLGFYHSIMDWHHPDYLPRRDWDGRPGGDLDAYVAHMKGQIRELLTGYGDVAVLWFDGEWEDSWNHERGLDLYRYVRRLSPSIVVNNRVDKGRGGMGGLTKEGGFAGDFGTPEQEVPKAGLPGVDWESCMTMNDTWGFKTADQNWKPAAQLVETLFDVTSKGGNYLLNVGPTAEGAIPEPSVERLAAIGRWMKANGDAIHGTGATPFRDCPWRCTTKPGRLFVYVNGKPPPKLDLPLQNAVKRACYLSDPGRKPLFFDATPKGVTVSLHAPPSDELGFVVAIEVEGQPARR